MNQPGGQLDDPSSARLGAPAGPVPRQGDMSDGAQTTLLGASAGPVPRQGDRSDGAQTNLSGAPAGPARLKNEVSDGAETVQSVASANPVRPNADLSDSAETTQSGAVAWVLRQADMSDLAELARFERRVFAADAWSVDMIREELAGPLRRYLVVEAPGRSVGASGVGPEPDGGWQVSRILAYAGAYLGPDATDIMTIGVAKAARRGGIGRALLAALLDAARQGGSRQAFLDVRVDNDPAIALYRSFGFESVSLRRGYYQPDGVDALVMRLDLTTPGPKTVGRPQAIGWSDD